MPATSTWHESSSTARRARSHRERPAQSGSPIGRMALHAAAALRAARLPGAGAQPEVALKE